MLGAGARHVGSDGAPARGQRRGAPAGHAPYAPLRRDQGPVLDLPTRLAAMNQWQ